MDVPSGVPSAFRTPHSLRSDEIAGQRHRPRVFENLRAEWSAITIGRRNLLISGACGAIDSALAEMTPHLLGPVRVFDPQKEQSLPALTEGTLILVEVAALTREQQVDLLEWLDKFAQRRHVQVVSTTSRALFGLVECGEFLASLYYRLNVLRLDLEPPAGES